jgi:two-component sensor histidine kinase
VEALFGLRSEIHMPAQLVKTLLDPIEAQDNQLAEIWLKESDHRIANNLTLVGGLLRLQAAEIVKRQRDLSPKEALLALEEASRRIETVGSLHRLLAQRSDNGDLDATKFLRDIAEATVFSQTHAGRACLTFLSSKECSVRAAQALPMGLIVGELVTNSVKYAHPAGVKGVISVMCDRNADGGIDLEVSDDGVGLPDGFHPQRAESLGLRLVRVLAQQLGARLTFIEPGIGLTVRVSAPA